MSEAIGRMLRGKRAAEEAAMGSTHQSQPMDVDQVKNSAGGFVWEISLESRLRRFLCLGTEGGSYYAGEAELTLENALACQEMLEAGEGDRLVEIVKEMSVSGRCAKQQPTLFALAMAARSPTECLSPAQRRAVAAAAYAALPHIARIPTHLFLFVEYAEKLGKTSGWGRAHRGAVARWYLSKAPEDLAFAITKYPSRGGWAHRDLLRLAHPKAKDAAKVEGLDEEELKARVVEMDRVLAFATKGQSGLSAKVAADPEGGTGAAVRLLDAVETLKKTEREEEAVGLIKTYGLVREHLPTQLLNSPLVWAALFPGMPFTALIRNLPKMTKVGLFEGKKNERLRELERRLGDEEGLKKARVHPYSILLAHETYKSGHGQKGKQEWIPNPAIVKALDGAFYKAFHNVPSTGKRYLVALDVSGSMCSPIQGSAVTARVASAAMALIHLRTESGTVDIVSFHHGLTPLKLRKEMSLDDVVEKVSGLPFGATDCSLPMEWARTKRKDYDVFVVYTDNETYYGKIHPAEAMRKYRKARIADARLIVVGMTATKFSIADPKDPGMLDVAGFDAAAPELMRNFVLGLV